MCLSQINDVQRQTTAGFASGRLVITGVEDFSGKSVTVHFQNENLVAMTTDLEGNQKVFRFGC